MLHLQQPKAFKVRDMDYFYQSNGYFKAKFYIYATTLM